MPSRPAAVRPSLSLFRTKSSSLTYPPTAILGATNPLASAPGTIRGDFAIDVGRNVCHGSDSVENAKKEIALWFKDSDLVSWKTAQFDWVYEKA